MEASVVQESKCTIVVAIDGVTLKTLHLIDSLVRYTDENVEVIFISLDSDPLFSELIDTLGVERFRVFEERDRMGQARGYNKAFKLIDSKYTAWLSNDTYLNFSCIKLAIDILESRDDFGMVGLKTKDINGPYISSEYIGGILPTGILNVNQGVLRTSLLKTIGGFDEKFINYGIDPVLTTEVLLSNYKICLTKKIALLHDRDWGGDQNEVPLAMKLKTVEWKKKYVEKFSAIIPEMSVNSQIFKKIISILLKYSSRTLRNTFLARSISNFDFFSNLNKPFHLVQNINLINSRKSREKN